MQKYIVNFCKDVYQDNKIAKSENEYMNNREVK